MKRKMCIGITAMISIIIFQYDMNEVIEKELNDLFETITKKHLELPEEFEEREFIHLYDFQKFYLFKSTERFLELLTKKVDHDWTYYVPSIMEELSKYSVN